MRKNYLNIALVAAALMAFPVAAQAHPAKLTTHGVSHDYHLCASAPVGCAAWRADLSFTMYYDGTGGDGWAWGNPRPTGLNATGSIGCSKSAGTGFKIEWTQCAFVHSPATSGHYACACMEFNVLQRDAAGTWQVHAVRFLRFHLYPNGVGKLISGHIPLK
jgi:hypothetical protein